MNVYLCRLYTGCIQELKRSYKVSFEKDLKRFAWGLQGLCIGGCAGFIQMLSGCVRTQYPYKDIGKSGNPIPSEDLLIPT